MGLQFVWTTSHPLKGVDIVFCLLSTSQPHPMIHVGPFSHCTQVMIFLGFASSYDLFSLRHVSFSCSDIQFVPLPFGKPMLRGYFSNYSLSSERVWLSSGLCDKWFSFRPSLVVGICQSHCLHFIHSNACVSNEFNYRKRRKAPGG